ncbi:MAG: sensor histidine kinase [Chitinophagaceae bacterium]|nr:sensor histidine kinase [Chitinophagaceae bacterium]MCW5926905.1 sensor histidine kinase [Chitinophagaceae bacterium]
MNRMIVIAGLLFLSVTSRGQRQYDQAMVDQIYQMPDDTGKVNRLNDYAMQIQAASPRQALVLLQEAGAISRRLKYEYGEALSYSLLSGMYFYKMKLDSSRLLLENAFSLIADKTDDPSRQLHTSLLLRKASLFHQQQNSDSAIDYYLQAAKAYADRGQAEKGIVAFYNIAGIYSYLKDTAKALSYARQTRGIAIASKDSVYLLRSLIVLGDALALAEKFDSMQIIAQAGMQEAITMRMPFAAGKFHALTGQYYAQQTRGHDSAIYHYQAALDTFSRYNIPFDKALVLQYLGNVLLKAKDYHRAIQYLQEATALARELDLNQVLYYTLQDLAGAYEKSGNFPEAYRHLNEFIVVNDTLEQRNNRKTVMELEARYQTQKKEARLAVQQKDIQEKKFTIWFLLAGLVTLSIISYLLYRNDQHKHKIQLHRINELENQKMLMATEAVIKGEEQERTRLAKDLHDGLGGMLSGIKYSFQAMKGNLIMTPENQQAFERSMDMLDSSIKEMRRVAHNMMPEALVKFGLDVALKDFCNDINESRVLKVNYLSNRFNDAAIDQTTAITVYRVVQELVNNTIKHAGATSAIVQVDYTPEKLTLTVEDNGKGFDTSSVLQQPGGIGWNNIQSRVDFLKGRLDVKSDKNTGTSVLIEFKI